MAAESRADRLAYIQSSEVKMIRRKHRIGFCVGSTTAAQLIEKLSKLPPDVTVDEVDQGDDDITTIEFHEERRDSR